MADEETANELDDGENEDFGFDNFEEGRDADYYKEDLEEMIHRDTSPSPEKEPDYDYSLLFDNEETQEYDPNKVYRIVPKNRSAYNLFIKEKFSKKHYSKIKKLSTKEIMDLLSLEWKNLSPEEKKPFQDRAQKAAYLKFKKSKAAKIARKTDKQKPKAPLAPFTRFQMDERKANAAKYNGMCLEAAARDITEKWKALDSKTKSKYITQFEVENKKYKKALNNLKTQMLKGKKPVIEKKKVHQPFVAFIRAKYNEVKATVSDLKHRDVMKKLSDLWKKLPQEAKKAYQSMLNSANPNLAQQSAPPKPPLPPVANQPPTSSKPLSQ